MIFVGAPLGVVIAMPVAGAISSSAVGWPVAFYLYGGVGILWSILWLMLGSDSPSTDRFISPGERKYIQAGTTVDEEKVIYFSPQCSIKLYSVVVQQYVKDISKTRNFFKGNS